MKHIFIILFTLIAFITNAQCPRDEQLLKKQPFQWDEFEYRTLVSNNTDCPQPDTLTLVFFEEYIRMNNKQIIGYWNKDTFYPEKEVWRLVVRPTYVIKIYPRIDEYTFEAKWVR